MSHLHGCSKCGESADRATALCDMAMATLRVIETAIAEGDIDPDKVRFAILGVAELVDQAQERVSSVAKELNDTPARRAAKGGA